MYFSSRQNVSYRAKIKALAELTPPAPSRGESLPWHFQPLETSCFPWPLVPYQCGHCFFVVSVSLAQTLLTSYKDSCDHMGPGGLFRKVSTPRVPEHDHICQGPFVVYVNIFRGMRTWTLLMGHYSTYHIPIHIVPPNSMKVAPVRHSVASYFFPYLTSNLYFC